MSIIASLFIGLLFTEQAFRFFQPLSPLQQITKQHPTTSLSIPPLISSQMQQQAFHDARYPYYPTTAHPAIRPTVTVYPASWKPNTRLLHIGLQAYPLTPMDPSNTQPPIIASYVSAEITFNPDRVARYQQINRPASSHCLLFQPTPQIIPEALHSTQYATHFRAGDAATILYELTLNTNTDQLVGDLRYIQAIDPDKVDVKTYAKLTLTYQAPDSAKEKQLHMTINDRHDRPSLSINPICYTHLYGNQSDSLSHQSITDIDQ